MAKFCHKCGTALGEGTKFCPGCGSPVLPSAQPAYPPQENTAFPGLKPGFSERVHDPEILAAVRKNKKATGIFTLILVPVPFIGFTIFGAVSNDMELTQGMLYGAIISAVFLLFALISLIKSRSSNTYEGVVTDKKQRERADNRQGGADFYTEYITVVRTADGKKKKIVEHSNGIIVAYHYLQVGDRFRYHPQFAFPYELYDKNKAPYLACVACGMHNSVTDDRCRKCNTPLLK